MFSTTCNIMGFVATPLWAKCEGEAHTPKSGNLESSGTPENSEDDLRSQTSLHQCAPGVIGKVLNCRCPKWPRMSHLDICNPSYGQEKGRESNWQFDSRPLKVRNRPVPDVRSRSATWRWKALFEGYKFGSDLVLIWGWGEELQSPKVPGVQSGTVSGLHAEYTIGSMVVASPELGPWCVMWVRVSPWLVPTPNACRMSSNQLVLVWMQVRDQISWSLPSLIPELPTQPLYPS
jgi:hypothetical protein